MQRPKRQQRNVPIGHAATEDHPPPFMTAGEAAALLGVSHDHITRAIRSGSIPGFKWGGIYRILRTFVDDLYAEVCSGRGVVIEDYAAMWRENAKAAA